MELMVVFFSDCSKASLVCPGWRYGESFFFSLSPSFISIGVPNDTKYAKNVAAALFYVLCI